MKKSKFLIGCIVLVVLVSYCKNAHIHLPGHGNWEEKNLKGVVVNHVSNTLTDGETVEFRGKYNCEDYKENGEVRFSANVIYDVISKDGTKERRTAHVICNEDKDIIIEWRDEK